MSERCIWGGRAEMRRVRTQRLTLKRLLS